MRYGAIKGQFSQAEMGALAAIAERGPLPLKDLASLEHLSPSTITRVTERLVKKRYARTRPDPHDGRVTLVEITLAGTDFLNEVTFIGLQWINLRLELLTPRLEAKLPDAVELLESLVSVGIQTDEIAKGLKVDEASLSFRLGVATGRLARRLRHESDDGLAQPELAALSSVVAVGPLSARDLAALERVSAPTITRVVSILVRKGLVVRERDPIDWRVRLIVATPKGERALSESKRRQEQWIRVQLCALDPRRRKGLRAAVDLMEGMLSLDDPPMIDT